MIVDFHVHAFPDKVAAKAIENFEVVHRAKCFSDGTIASLMKSMKEFGVDVSIIQSVSTDPRQVVSINTWASEISKIEREDGNIKIPPIIGFGTIHPKFEGYREEIPRMKELGIKGVKFQPFFQKFYPDDENMFPIYEELIKAGMVIMFHAGDEINPAEIVYSTPERLARVLDTMQSLINECNHRTMNGSAKIVAAHLGGYMLWDRVEKHLLGRELFLDVSYIFGHLDLKRAEKMMKAHGTDKILFGSDFPFALAKDDIKAIMQLDLNDEERENIFGKNALGLLGLDNV